MKNLIFECTKYGKELLIDATTVAEMELKAYVFVQTIEGNAFDLGSLATGQGQVLEVAVRRVKEGIEDDFQASRKAFAKWLDGQDGVLGSWEFQVVSSQDTERLTVGMSVYENQEKFQPWQDN